MTTTAAQARAAGFTYRWEDDWQVGSHVEEYGESYGQEPESCEWASLVAPDGLVVASVGCIDDASAEYVAEIEDDLATEAEQYIRAYRLRKLADALSDAPGLTSQGADLMVRLDHTANRLLHTAQTCPWCLT